MNSERTKYPDMTAGGQTFKKVLYKDKNTDGEEYADYHDIEGFPTAFSITRIHNDEMARQIYIDKVHYNQDLAAEFWDINAVAKKIKK